MTEFGELTFPPNQYDSMSRANQCALYVVLSDPFVKFGLSRNPLARLEGLRAANPHKLRMVAAWWIPMATAAHAEAYCHRHFRAAWHRSEWFKVDWKEARRVAKLIATAAAASRDRPLKPVSLPLAADFERELRLRSRGPGSQRILTQSPEGATPETGGSTGNYLGLKDFSE